ncbi:MAG: YjjG family noncanonical pyrimidine nucleotidase [Paludibacter sp.]|nr:YjjG family noncanonical pyrimidine nucleotidase [Paludibacter sp.]
MYKFVFIDLDDTLWDFHTNARISLEQMFIERNLKQFFENFDEFFLIYAKRNIELWEAYGKGEISKDFLMAERFRYPLSRMGVDDELLAEEIGHQYLDILPNQTTLMPDALETLDYLKAKYALTIISNGFTEVQYRKINSCGIRDYFAHIVLSEEAKALKPNPKIFEYALQLNGGLPHEAIMIGDSYEADIRGAQNAGIDQVYYPLNYQFKENQTATYRIKGLRDLLQIM